MVGGSLRIGVLLAVVLVADGASRASACAVTSAIAAPATIVSVSDGFPKLSDGTAVRLAGLDRTTLIADALVGADVHFQATGEIDRHGAKEGDLFVGGVSLRHQLLAEGRARLRGLKGDDPCLADLRAAEQSARRAALGLWRETGYGVVDAADTVAMRARAGHFVVATGKVVHVGVRNRRIYLDFGTDWRKDGAATLDRSLIDPVTSGDPTMLVGRRIEVRGVVAAQGAPRIAVETSGSLLVLDAEDGGRHQ